MKPKTVTARATTRATRTAPGHARATTTTTIDNTHPNKTAGGGSRGDHDAGGRPPDAELVDRVSAALAARRRRAAIGGRPHRRRRGAIAAA